MRSPTRIRSIAILLVCALLALGFVAFRKSAPPAANAIKADSSGGAGASTRRYAITPPLSIAAPKSDDSGVQPSEFDGANVQDIDVRGAIHTSEATILKAIRTRKGRPFDVRDWTEDYQRLLALGHF